jgi:hypothetical protein
MIALKDHWLYKHLQDFNLDSYNLGIIAAFSEVVAAGCKQLALSAPLTPEEYERLKEPIMLIAKENEVQLYIDDNFLETRLFNPYYTRGKFVIHIAKNPEVFKEYLKLKEINTKHANEGITFENEEEVARALGRLLSYDDDKIEALLKKPSF